jgi:formate-dependent nitrite reductase membrane component NrfD
MPPAEHFAAPPGWEWWILGYFFFGGLSGGSYAIGTLLRLVGTAADQRAALSSRGSPANRSSVPSA